MSPRHSHGEPATPAGQAAAPLTTGMAMEGRALGPAARWFLVALGSLAVVLGIIGIVLPLVPTVPFLLLAAACYARSSEKCYAWLLNHRWFGEHIRNYRSGKGIPLRAKAAAIVLLWLAIGASAVFVIDIAWVRILLLAIAAGVTVQMCCLPTLRVEGRIPE
jgi:hypothetical protein